VQPPQSPRRSDCPMRCIASVCGVCGCPGVLCAVSTLAAATGILCVGAAISHWSDFVVAAADIAAY
jgi:hypothetical protein